MKLATGNYINLYTAVGYSDYGLKGWIDIVIFFIESFELTEDVVDSIDLLIEEKLTELGKKNPDADENEIYEAVVDVLDRLDYEYMGIVVNREG